MACTHCCVRLGVLWGGGGEGERLGKGREGVLSACIACCERGASKLGLTYVLP
jgi:hypothetical protein